MGKHNKTITLTLHAETEAQVVRDDSTKIATALRCILAKPGFVSINEDSNVSFMDMVTTCGPDHNALSSMLMNSLTDVCARLLPDSGVDVDVNIEELDEQDSFTITISISNATGLNVINAADVKSVNGKLEIIYK